jgi:hypothetical protein
MIQIVKNGNVAAILFTDSDFYLFNSGQIIVPLNSLSMVVDKSDMATFRKASNNDLLFSAKISKITMGGTQLTKANAKTLFDSILAGPTGGGGFRFVSVETLPTTGENGVIYLVPEGDDSCEEYVWLADEQRYEKLGFETDLTGYVNSGNFETYLEESQGFGVLDTEVYMLSGDVSTLSGQVTANTASIATKQNARTQGTITKTQDNYTLDLSFEILLSAYTSGADVILQQGNNDRVFQLVKVARDEMTFTYTNAEDGYIEGFTVTSADTLQHFVYDISTKLLDKQDTLTAGEGIRLQNNVISVTGGTPSSGYVTTEVFEDSELVTAAALNDLNTRVETLEEGGGGGSGLSANIVECTQAEYSAMTGHAADTIYVISDAELAYYTASEVDDELTPINDSISGLSSDVDAIEATIGDINDALDAINGDNNS